MFGRKSIERWSTQRQRCLRLEPLETRAMLSHPTVTAVNVASTDWASGFVSYLESSGLGAGGYAIPVGSSTQLRTLSWTNINQIRITFSEDVVVDAADLSISGVNTTARAFSGFSYNSTTHTATWTLSASIAKDKILIDLDADGMDPVVSVSTEDALAGGWTDCVSTFPSGVSDAVADFQFRFNVLPGDADVNNAVNICDAIYVNQKVGTSIGDAGYNYRYDMDGSGQITSSDYSAVTSRLGSLLPSGSPAGMTNDAPTTAGITDTYFDMTDDDELTLALSELFDDAETLSTDLTYAIVQNSNTSLFDSLTFDSSGNLIIDFDDDANGEATLTIRATDAGGIFVETSVTVYASIAPMICDFQCANTSGDSWTITGKVTDLDDSVVGSVITFGGVLAAYNLTTTVTRTDGMFFLTVDLVGLQSGTATAQTVDPQGVASNTAQYWII